MSNYFPFATITDARNYVNSGIWNWRNDGDAVLAADIFYCAQTERDAVARLADVGLIEAGDVKAWMVDVEEREAEAEAWAAGPAFED